MAILRPSYKWPRKNIVGGCLLDGEYVWTKSDKIHEIATFLVICITLDDATNKASKQVLNMMAYVRSKGVLP